MNYPTGTDFFTAEINERILKKEHAVIQCKLPIDALQLQVEVHQVVGEMLMRLQYKVYSEDIGKFEEKVHFEVYESWWDHFKATYAPTWFKKWSPVRVRFETKTVKVSARALYPNFRPLKDEEVVVVREITAPKSWKQSADY